MLKWAEFWKEIFCNIPNQKKWENAVLMIKNAGASRGLRWALDPGQYWLTLLAQLCFTTSVKSQKKLLAPPLYQILGPMLIRPLVTTFGRCKHICEGQLRKKYFSIQKLFKLKNCHNLLVDLILFLPLMY